MNGRTPVRFMPFSVGGRDCVGQTLAKLNLATTLAQLYGSFTFKLAEEVRGVPSSEPMSSLPTAFKRRCDVHKQSPGLATAVLTWVGKL